MNIWLGIALSVHVVTAIVIIVLVLLQHGKGADVGAAFGGGSSGSLFGATGSANFLSRLTAVAAAVFFLSSMGLTYLAFDRGTGESVGVMDAVKGAPAGTRPGAPSADSVPGGDSAPKASDGAKPDAAPASKADEVPK